MDFDSMFWTLGHKYTDHSPHLSLLQGMRRFKAFYGVSPNICSLLWRFIAKHAPETAEPKHLLWTLNFFKQYNVETTSRSIFKTDEKTFRKYIWIFTDLLADIDVFSFEDRLADSLPGQVCFTSLDGVDFKVLEPVPFNKDYYSHKFKAAALRYEIGLCIKTGHIVWKYGGYPAGLYPDLKLSRELYVHQVMPGEMTLADKGYADERYFIRPRDTNSVGHKFIMSRHETVNKRIRHFNIMSNTFRHDRLKHNKCFDAVVNITALIIQLEEPLFSVINA